MLIINQGFLFPSSIIAEISLPSEGIMSNPVCQIFDYRRESPVRSKRQISDAFCEWFRLTKKQKKSGKWHWMYFQLLKILLPEVQFDQIIIDPESLVEKMVLLMANSTMKHFQLFEGLNVKSTQVVVVIDPIQALQVVCRNDLGEVKSTIKGDSLQPINNRADAILQLSNGNKEEIFVYSNTAQIKSLVFNVEKKQISKAKHEIQREDYHNKVSFVQNYLFHAHKTNSLLTSVTVSRMKQNEIRKSSAMNSQNVYLLYSGAMHCKLHLTKIQESELAKEFQEENQEKVCRSKMFEKKAKSSSLMAMTGEEAKPAKEVKRIEVHRGSILQLEGYRNILVELGQSPIYAISQIKALQECIVIELQCEEVIQLLRNDKKLRAGFLTQYSSIFEYQNDLNRNSSTTRVSHIVEKMSGCRSQQDLQCPYSITTRNSKNYHGFHKRRPQSSLPQPIIDDGPTNADKEAENLATIDIYEQMVLNKQKVIKMQKKFKEDKQLLLSFQASTKQKLNSLEQSKRMKEEYKKLKQKNLKIKNLVCQSSNRAKKRINGNKQYKQIQDKVGVVTGMFDNQLQQIQRMLNAHKQSLQVREFGEDGEEETVSKKRKRKGIRLNSCSPSNFSETAPNLKVQRKDTASKTVVFHTQRNRSSNISERKSEIKPSFFSPRNSVENRLKLSKKKIRFSKKNSRWQSVPQDNVDKGSERQSFLGPKHQVSGFFTEVVEKQKENFDARSNKLLHFSTTFCNSVPNEKTQPFTEFEGNLGEKQQRVGALKRRAHKSKTNVVILSKKV